MRAILSAILTLIILTTALAETDTRTALLDGEAKLDKPITLKLRAASLREVLEAVQAQTGVKLKTEREVGGDKATVYAKDKPARDVLRALAHCFNLGWGLDDRSDPPVLTLWMDPSYLESMRQRRWEDYVPIVKKFDTECQAAADYIRSGQIYEPTEAETSGVTDDDVISNLYWRSANTQSNYRSAAVLQYLALSQQQRKDLTEGKDLAIPGSAVCNEARAKYPEVTSMTFWIERSLAGCLLQGTVQPALQPTDWTLYTLATFDDTRYQPRIASATEALMKDARLDRELPAPPTSEPASKATSAPETTPDHGLLVPSPIGNASVPRPMKLARPGEGSGATPATMSDGLLAVAEALDIPIVAQYLSEYSSVDAAALNQNRLVIAGSAKKKANEKLADLCSLHKFTVERDGDFLLAKSVLWHRLRQREVPEEQIKRWQSQFCGLMFPTFEASVEMGSTSWDQVRGIIANSPYWFGVRQLSSLAPCEYALKLYSTLSPPQKRALEQGIPVQVSVLTPSQRALFIQAYEVRARPTYKDAQDPNWAKTATFSVDYSPDWSGSHLYAIANMQCMDTALVTIELQADMSQQQPDRAYVTDEMSQAQYMELLKQQGAPRILAAARKLAERVRKDHPEVKARDLGIYKSTGLAFKMQIGEKQKSYGLPCSGKVPW